MSLVIDPEFQALCPPLLPEEREQLEASLLAEGCRDPLCVWEGDVGSLLLDGHNRYILCTQHNIPFETQEIELATREEAINWIIANQLGRRNLTPEQKSYLRGKRYNLEKKPQGGDHKSKYKNDTLIREKLAKEYAVSPPTITKDGDFATAVDTLEAQVRQDIRETILRRHDREQGKITKKQTIETGKLVQEQKVAPQPFMRREGWKPYQVLEAIEVLGELPTAEHAALNTLLDQPFIPAEDGLGMLKNLHAMPLEDRQRLYHLATSADPRDRSHAKTLAARKPPEPDPQLALARHLIQAVEDVRTYQRRNWQRPYAQEPWSPELAAIDTLLADVQARWRQIAAQVKTHHTERIASYAIAVTP